MSSSTPVEFWGKLYQGKAQRDLKNMEFSIDDLKEMGNLKDTPIWLEHNAKTGNIGKILKSWIDPRDGWLWIHGCLNGPEEIGEEFHGELRSKLVKGELPDLSIHWVGQADASTDVVDPSTKAVIEASLTKEGFFNGTNLLSVAAHANSKTKTLHVQQPGQRLSLHPPKSHIIMSQDIQTLIEDIKKKTGVEITPEELRRIAPDGTGVEGALLVLDAKLNELSQKKGEEMSAKERELVGKSLMSEEKEQELEQLRAFRGNVEKQYAEEQGKIAEEMYGVIEKRIPEERREHVKKSIMQASSHSDYAPLFEVVKLFGQAAAENGNKARDYEKQIARSKKDYLDLVKERDSLSQQQATSQQVEVSASSYASKRGIDKDAESNNAKKSKLAATKPVEQMASAEAAQANFFFGKAIGIGGAQGEFGSALDKLASEAKLTPGLPMVDWSHYRGYNQGPTYNRDGVIPFGQR